MPTRLVPAAACKRGRAADEGLRVTALAIGKRIDLIILETYRDVRGIIAHPRNRTQAPFRNGARRCEAITTVDLEALEIFLEKDVDDTSDRFRSVNSRCTVLQDFDPADQ